MSLNLNAQHGRYTGSTAFNDAFNDAQFVRTFGLIALVGSFLGILGGAVAIGLGLAVLGFGTGRYFKVLGGMVMVLGVLSLIFAPAGILGSLVLAAGIVWKALSVRRVLDNEGKDDPDWHTAHSRAIIGLVTSSAGALVSICYGLLILLGCLLRASGRFD